MLTKKLLAAVGEAEGSMRPRSISFFFLGPVGGGRERDGRTGRREFVVGSGDDADSTVRGGGRGPAVVQVEQVREVGVLL